MHNFFSAASLDAARTRGDAPADKFVENVLERADTKAAFYEALGAGSEPLWGFVAAISPTLSKTLQTTPAHAKRYWQSEASRIFANRGGDVMLLLGLYSLPYCYAAANGAQVLAATGRLSGAAQALVRLQETGTFVHTVLTGTEQEARQACLHVRVIHALVRYHLVQKGWNTDELGIPVNQEDMAGTNLAFGYLTVRGLRKLGVPLSSKEAEAYLGWFSVLGTWLGVEDGLCAPTQEDAYLLATAIEKRHHKASTQGQSLTQALIQSFTDSEAPDWLKSRTPQLISALVGPEISEILALPAVEPNYLNAIAQLNLLRTLSPFKIDFYNPSIARREVKRNGLNLN